METAKREDKHGAALPTQLAALQIDEDVAVSPERAVVAGVGTVDNKDMPFVNRHEEIWQLFRVNASIQQRILNATQRFDDFRALQLLFCVQYFGAGKSTLGRMFPSKVLEHKEFMNKKVNQNKEKLAMEWDVLQKQGIQRVLIDTRSVPNILHETATVILDRQNHENKKRRQGKKNKKKSRGRGRKQHKKKSGGAMFDPSNPKLVARDLVEYAQRHGPTLFHFDEVGSKAEHNIPELRALVVAVWACMWETKSEGEMPRVYFLVTGKSTQPFEDVGSGSISSPCGSFFLVLDMLTPRHIGEVRQVLQKHGKLVLNELKDEDAEYFDQCLARATGGAPRLLLYTLRTLHYLDASLASRQLIEAAVFEKVYATLRQIDVVFGEFYPVANKEEFVLLLSFQLRQARLKATTQVHIEGKLVRVARMLRFQPFFLSRDLQRADREDFTLHLPLFHLKAAREIFVDAVPLLFISMAGAPLRANEPWRIFELLPAHIIATKAAFDDVLGHHRTTWAAAIPLLLGNSAVAAAISFDLGRQPFLVHHIKEKLPDAIEQDAERFVQLGGAVMGRDKSDSEDLFHVQRLANGEGHAVVGWQQKFLVNTVLQMATVRDEACKGSKKLPALLIIFAATVGKELECAIERSGKVLVLISWDHQQAGEYAFASGKGSAGTSVLLWRAYKKKRNEDQDEGERGEDEDEDGEEDTGEDDEDDDEDDTWCVFPNHEPPNKAKSPKTKAARVVVRPGLELVIPHHDIIKQLVGPQTFESLSAAARDPSDLDASTACITTLSEVLRSGRGRATEEEAPLPPQGVWVKVVDTEGNAVGDTARVTPVPVDVELLREAVLEKKKKQLGEYDADQLKVYAAGADVAKDAPLRRSAVVPEGTDEDNPLVVVVPGN